MNESEWQKDLSGSRRSNGVALVASAFFHLGIILVAGSRFVEPPPKVATVVAEIQPDQAIPPIKMEPLQDPEPESGPADESDLSYGRFYDENPHHPMRCMAGNIAQSSGDHETALRIYRGCAADGDNFSIIALAQYYEQGIGGVAKNPAMVVELFKRVAMSSREAYRSDGMLYYGLALYYGYGIARDRTEGLAWLHRAADAGAPEAQAFLALLAAGTIPSQSHYFEP